MQVIILRPFRKDNIYFRTIEEREKISNHRIASKWKNLSKTAKIVILCVHAG